MSEIKIDTARFEREHGKPPTPRLKRYWCFTIVSPSITAKDHFLDLTAEQMTYEKALDRAMLVAKARRSERIIVDP